MSPLVRKSAPWLLLILLPLAVLRKLWLSSGIVYSAHSDLIAQFLSHKVAARRALFDEGMAPIWDPAMNAGTPALGNPQTAILNPLEWPFLLLPLPLASNAHAVLSVIVAGLSMWLLARELVGPTPPALLASVAYALSFHQLAAVYTGWTPNLSTYAVTPLLLWVVAWAKPVPPPLSGPARAKKIAVVSVVVALAAVQGDMQAVYYASLASVAFAALLLFRTPGPERGGFFFVLAAGAGAGLLLGAPALLPRLEYALESTRGLRDYGFFLGPPPSAAELARLFDPETHGGARVEFWERNFYLGLWLFPLASAALERSFRRAVWPASAVVLAVLLSFDTPLLRLLHHVFPGFWLFRQPSRLLITAQMALAVTAAFGLQALLTAEPKSRTRLVVAIGGVLSVAVGLTAAPNDARALAPLFAGILACSLLPLAARVPAPALVLPWCLLPALDAETRLGALLEVRPASAVLERPPILDALARGPDRGRALAVGREALPYGMAGLYGVDLVNGYGGIMVSRFVDYMDVMQTGEPSGSRRAPTVWNDVHGLANRELLRTLDVRHIVTTRKLPLEAAGFELVQSAPRVESYVFYRGVRALPRHVYRATEPLGAAFLASEVRPAPADDRELLAALAVLPSARIAYVSGLLPNHHALSSRGTARETERGTNRYRYAIEAEGPAFVVLSQVAYPGWVATLDDEPVKLERTQHAFIGCFVPPGRHELVLRMTSPSLALGATLSAITALGLLLGAAVPRGWLGRLRPSR